MAPLKRYFPRDYERICACYPYAEAASKREEFFDFFNKGRLEIKEAVKKFMEEKRKAEEHAETV